MAGEIPAQMQIPGIGAHKKMLIGLVTRFGLIKKARRAGRGISEEAHIVYP